MPNYSLNFSRPSSSVVLQYFNFLRLGRAGYERIVASVLENAQALAARLAATGRFELINDAAAFPIVVVRARRPDELDLQQLSSRLREHGWIVPAYTLPPDAEQITVLRMVIKESFSRDMVDLLCRRHRNRDRRALPAAPGVGRGRSAATPGRRRRAADLLIGARRPEQDDAAGRGFGGASALDASVK